MHRALRTGAPLALVAAALLGLPAPAAALPAPAAALPAAALPAAALPAPAAALLSRAGGPASAPDSADLPALQAALEQATTTASALAEALEGEAARAGVLRTELDRLAAEQDAARAAVGSRARAAYLAVQATRVDPLAGLQRGLVAPDLRALADAELARRGAAAAVRTELALSDAVGEHASAAAALQESARAYRDQLGAEAAQALEAQEAARALLARAEQALAVEQAALAARSAQRSADAQRAVLATAQQSVAQARGRLDAASAVVTRALTPAQSARSARAAVREAPVVALVEAAGAGLPAGYRQTGQVQRGVASWYGPGFVGNPTASGAPYDPERLTCAHKTLPLGTVVRVVRGPLAISCLVNDRGPYVGARIIDLSRAGSRALGFDGVAEVVVEVLAPLA